MSQEIVETAVAVREPRALMLMPVMKLAEAQHRLREFQEFVAGYLVPSENGGQDGGDYGAIPGAGSKKVLFKSGADKLCELYGLYDEYEITSREDFETGLFFYTVKCILKSRRDDSKVGEGVGSCSTFESKYRWRDSQRKCPKCNNTTIIKGKEDFGGGWLCWAKKGGCGAKFKDGDQSIEGQTIGRVDNPDIFDVINTVLKMAKKRAKIDVVIGVTRSSGLFTQDLEEIQAETPKKEVKVTTEDIVIGSDKEGAKPSQEGKAPAAEKEARLPEKARVETDSPAPSLVSVAETPGLARVEYISTPQQKNFHIQCRKAVPEARYMEADTLTYKWLGDHGYRDRDGLPTAAMIPAAGWLKIREAACEWLKTQ